MLVKQAGLAHVAPDASFFPADELPQIAFAGRSNVGKSSLINAMTGRKKLAYTSSTPGKTRNIYFFDINSQFYFVDLPGYGYAAIPKGERRYFKVLVEQYLEKSNKLRACLLLLDPKRPVGKEEVDFLYYLHSARIPAIVVFTRWDRVRSAKRYATKKERRNELAEIPSTILFASSRTKEGVDRLWQELDRHLIIDLPEEKEPT